MSADDKTRILPEPTQTGVGTQLSGIYELDERLASGGMGEVFRGHNIQTGDHVAIKIVLPEFARDQTILSLFRKEASILNHLSHEAVVRYHVFTIDPGIGRPYLAMEYVDGESLFDVMRRGPMSASDARKLCHRLASGLHAVHKAGAIHRDLSPDNIILPDGSVEHAKIIDFGIARSAKVGGETLIGGRFAGKYNYVSPEQLGLYGGEVSEQSDIYSLGLVLAAALRGKPLDMSGSQFEVVEKRRAVPDLSDIDGEFRPTIQAMLQPDPRDRPASMADIAWVTRSGSQVERDEARDFNPQTGSSQIGSQQPGPSQVGEAPTARPWANLDVSRAPPPAAADSPALAGGEPRFVEHVRPAQLSKPRPAPVKPAGQSVGQKPAKTRNTVMAALAALVVVTGAGAYLGGLLPPWSEPDTREASETSRLTPDLSPRPADDSPPADDQAATKARSDPQDQETAPASQPGADDQHATTDEPEGAPDTDTVETAPEPPAQPIPTAEEILTRLIETQRANEENATTAGPDSDSVDTGARTEPVPPPTDEQPVVETGREQPSTEPTDSRPSQDAGGPPAPEEIVPVPVIQPPVAEDNPRPPPVDTEPDEPVAPPPGEQPVVETAREQPTTEPADPRPSQDAEGPPAPEEIVPVPVAQPPAAEDSPRPPPLETEPDEPVATPPSEQPGTAPADSRPSQDAGQPPAAEEIVPVPVDQPPAAEDNLRPPPFEAEPDQPAEPTADEKEPVLTLNVPRPDQPAPPADPIAQRVAWLRDFSGGECFYATPLSATQDAIEVEGFGTATEPFEEMMHTFQNKFGIEPDVQVRLIDTAQCEVTRFARDLSVAAGERPGLTLDRTDVASGSPISGAVVTPAGSRSSLLLIDHAGMTFSLDKALSAQDGRATFSVPINRAGDDTAGKPLPQLLVAITGAVGLQAATLTQPQPASMVFPKILSEIRQSGAKFSATVKYFQFGG